MFEAEQAFHEELRKDLQEEYQKYKNGNGDPDRIKLILQITNGHHKQVNTKIAMIKRERIESQGYDTHSGIAFSEYKKDEEVKKKAEMEEQQLSDNSDQGVQSNENQPELQHVHPVINKFEEKLPKHDEPKEIIKNIKVVAPKPSIKYSLDGFRPYAKMCDLFKSHAPIKIAGGT